MNRRFLLVGLTGGIATGKSTVSRIFRDLGCLIVDADLIARDVVEPGQPAYTKIVAEFGRMILDEEGRIDRGRLGALVFGDPEKRKRLEALTHPEIRARSEGIFEELVAQGFDGVVIYDAALLFEADRAREMDRLVVVVADEGAQVGRLTLRDEISREDALRKIRSQMPLAEKARQAHYVIDNSASREATEHQVREVHQKLLADRLALIVPDST